MDQTEYVEKQKNSQEACRKREARRLKKEAIAKEARQKKLEKPAITLDQSREQVKQHIERMTRRMREQRKFILAHPTAEIEIDEEFVARIKELTAPISVIYDRFPLQMAEFLTEGIKFPDDRIRQMCCDLFNSRQQYQLNKYLWKLIFSADFVPKAAREYFFSHEELFKKEPLMWELAERARHRFEGREDRMSPRILQREQVKAEIEDLYLTMRSRRKSFLATRQMGSLLLSEEQLEKIRKYMNIMYYNEFPIQVANLLYEGSKYPITEISEDAFNFWEGTLKVGMSDPFLWSKMLLSDSVPERVWTMLGEYANVLQNQKEEIFFGCKLKEDANHPTEEQKQMRAKICELYR